MSPKIIQSSNSVKAIHKIRRSEYSKIKRLPMKLVKPKLTTGLPVRSKISNMNIFPLPSLMKSILDDIPKKISDVEDLILRDHIPLPAISHPEPNRSPVDLLPRKIIVRNGLSVSYYIVPKDYFEVKNLPKPKPDRILPYDDKVPVFDKLYILISSISWWKNIDRVRSIRTSSISSRFQASQIAILYESKMTLTIWDSYVL